jgi:hypothetical protein
LVFQHTFNFGIQFTGCCINPFEIRAVHSPLGGGRVDLFVESFLANQLSKVEPMFFFFMLLFPSVCLCNPSVCGRATADKYHPGTQLYTPTQFRHCRRGQFLG